MAARRRRQYGTGSVTRRADGRWLGRIDAGFTPEGRRRVRSVVRATEADAKRALSALARDIESGDVSISPQTTVKSWCEEWLPRQRERVRPAAWNADRSAVRQWIIPTIGRRRLTDLTPADLRQLDATVLDAGRARSTALRVHATLMGALKAASLEGHAVPARIFQVPPPAQAASDREGPTVEQAVKLLKAAEADPRRSRWVAALLQGMRQGECIGLTWELVDLERGLIDVSWQLQALPYAHGCGDTPCGRKRGVDCPRHHFAVPVGYEHEQVHLRWHLVRPKTASGRRIMPLLPWMVTALKQWRESAPTSRLVWPAADGKPITPRADLAAWHELQTVAGVEHPAGRPFHLHEARHATATILMALGVDTQVIIAILGHASILSTRAYQHADLEMMRTALEGVAERLQLTA